MKKFFQSIIVLGAVFFGSCLEPIDKTFDTRTLVEFNATVITAPAVTKTYPLIALINKDSTVNAQVNLVGRQRTGETSVTVSIDKAETTAIEGTHYKLTAGGKVTFPANTSIANFPFQTVKAPAQAGVKVNIVFVLETTGDIEPSENYKKVGYAITL